MRLSVVATARNLEDITTALASQAGDGISRLVTFGSRAADYKASSLLRMTAAQGQRGHIMEGDRFTGCGLALTQSKWFELSLLEAMDTLQRGSEGHVYRSHELQSPSDYVNYVCIIADRIATILTEEEIDTVLFYDVPHLFYDSLMYHVAKALDLRTLVLRSAHMPQQFYSMSDITHLGHTRAVPGARPYPIEKGKVPELYYMKGIKQEKSELGHLTVRALMQLAAHVMMREPQLLLRPRRLWSIYRRMDAAARRLPKWRDPFAHFFHTDSLFFAEQLAEIEQTEPDLGQPFVYFPLHLQPEMTTSILGGVYRDQLMAIEATAAMLPEGYLIYVKENPKQDGRYRRSLFYHRLRRIRQVRMMPSHANTHDLTAASDYVATISGTVAWEAILMGKPALVFGDTWMQALPGVTRYRPGLCHGDIADDAVDHDALQQAVGVLVAASHGGTLSRHAARQDADHNAAANTEDVAATVWSLLQGETPLTFTAHAGAL
jgi:hypothetical protein